MFIDRALESALLSLVLGTLVLACLDPFLFFRVNQIIEELFETQEFVKLLQVLIDLGLDGAALI